MRRLYEEAGRDIITLGILSEDIAEALVTQYVSTACGL
jgi:hypothetical protein